jgi:hypothetical protein
MHLNFRYMTHETSHAPANARQTVPAAINASVGQAAELPVQLSNTSQTPVEARHVVPAALNTSVGQAAAAPVHVSIGSHSTCRCTTNCTCGS